MTPPQPLESLTGLVIVACSPVRAYSCNALVHVSPGARIRKSSWCEMSQPSGSSTVE